MRVIHALLKPPIATTLAVVFFAFLCAPLGAVAQTPGATIVGTWEGSFWTTDRSHRITKDGPWVFKLEFESGGGFEILDGYPISGVRRGTWRNNGATLTLLMDLGPCIGCGAFAGEFFQEFTFTVNGPAMSGVSTGKSSNPLAGAISQNNYKYELRRVAQPVQVQPIPLQLVPFQADAIQQAIDEIKNGRPSILPQPQASAADSLGVW
jgi:hypothetical protein